MAEEEFTIDNVIIGDKIIERITDSYGTYWFPLKRFFRIILCKSDVISDFRDSDCIKYMKTFCYSTDRKGMKFPHKVWCMNTDGIRYLLRHMKIIKTKDKMTYRAREKGFYEACQYFHVHTKQELDPIFISVPPKLNDYDFWSKMCLERDLSLTPTQKYKKCPKCGYYYPYKETYFGKKKCLSSLCLQCRGSNFKCHNKFIQYLFEHGGFDLLYDLENNKSPEIITDELKRLIEKGGRNV